jgi:tetratricopeptide (TPR) repeat protein
MQSVLIRIIGLAILLNLTSVPLLAVQDSAQPENETVNSKSLEEFEGLRQTGNEALYNLEYQTAREQFKRMTQIIPEHPAGYVYLANNFWLETLNASRRLSSSLYTGGSFYEQDAEQDKVDPKREREFTELVKKAIQVADARLAKNPKDVEALYYRGAALGLRAGYSVTVKRSFRRAIGDANESVKLQRKVVALDPQYHDAYLSIGLYDYIIGSLPWVWRTLARLAGLSGSKPRGIERLEMVTQKGKYTPDDARVLLIGIYTRERKPERALEMITFLANKYPKNYLLGIERAAMLFRMNRSKEGDQAFAELLKQNRIAEVATDIVNYQWGEALRSQGDHLRALERYNDVVKWQSSDPSLVSLSLLHSAQALEAAGSADKAMAQYQKVLERENVYDSHKIAKKSCAKCR